MMKTIPYFTWCKILKPSRWKISKFCIIQNIDVMISGVQNEDICYDSYSAFNIESWYVSLSKFRMMRNVEILIYDVQNEDNSIFYRVHNKDTVELRYNKGPRDWQFYSLQQIFFISRSFDYYWGRENRLLYRGLRYIEVCYHSRFEFVSSSFDIMQIKKLQYFMFIMKINFTIYMVYHVETSIFENF